MYSWLWRKLPGPIWLKGLIAAVMVGLVVWALFALVFPALDLVFVQDPTLA